MIDDGGDGGRVKKRGLAVVPTVSPQQGGRSTPTCRLTVEETGHSGRSMACLAGLAQPVWGSGRP